MDILKIIITVFLFAFSLGEIVRFGLGNNLYIKLIDVVTPVLIIVWIAANFKKLRNILKDKLFLPIFLVIIIFLISLAYNIKNFSGTEIFIAFSYIVRWMTYASLYFMVKNLVPKFKEKIIYLLVPTGVFFVLFGFLQYFFYSNLRNLYYLGWDEHMHRMFSTFLDPNFAGAFFVLYLIFLLSILLYLLNNNKLRQAWLIGLISFFTLMSILLTYSRSALIMLLVTTIIFFIMAQKIKWIFVIILIAIIFVSISSKNFNVENINLFRIASAEARLDSAKIAIKIIGDNPIFGVGFNSYRYVQIKYGFRDPVSSSMSHADAGTDNSFLFVLATAGIIGLFFYSNLLWNIIKKAYVGYKVNKNSNIRKYVSLAVLASMGGLIVNALFINSLFYSFIMIWMWILLGLISKNDS